MSSLQATAKRSPLRYQNQPDPLAPPVPMNQWYAPAAPQQKRPFKTPTPLNYDIPLLPTAHSNNSQELTPNHDDHATPDTAVPQTQIPQPPRAMSDEEQQLATKLKETYKNIVNHEEIVQKHCIEITIKINHLNHADAAQPPLLTRTLELLNDLWTIYHHNITLLVNYHDFLVTALKPLVNLNQFRTGKNIVELYKIPRRMWVYGVVGFLEVLKNIMAIFSDHEICLCFIAYCFLIILNLTDPALEMEGWWLEKLGDLSRMAIALYASKFIDWKISAEYWYSVSMKTLYGHGKIYYHMCTVQQDNLDALVNIGKLVICRDPFVPTTHYLRLVVENICTQRNILSLLELPIIDFIKIHKVLLQIHGNRDPQLAQLGDIHDSQIQYGIDLVTRYGLTFGSDTNGYNFFTRELFLAANQAPQGQHDMAYQPVSFGNSGYSSGYGMLQAGGISQQQPLGSIERMSFWANKGPLFAIANINHLVGFGDAKNPFAKIFLLPEALKERRDKKDRKRKLRLGSLNPLSGNGILGADATIDGQLVCASELSPLDWFCCLQFINRSVLELLIRILNHYLVGPKQALNGHVIVWLYFLIGVGNAVKQYPLARTMFGWLFNKLFPWELLITYLNLLLGYVKSKPQLLAKVARALARDDVLGYYNSHEFLPEVWKCWGTLWFDQVQGEKGDYCDLEEAGVVKPTMFDVPVSGSFGGDLGSDPRKRQAMEEEADVRIVRVLVLARAIADDFPLYGLVRTTTHFAYDLAVYNTTDSVLVQLLSQGDPMAYMEEFLLGDGRFVQNNLIHAILAHNLVQAPTELVEAKDRAWFGTPTPLHDGEEIVEVDELDGFGDLEFDDDTNDVDLEQGYRFSYRVGEGIAPPPMGGAAAYELFDNIEGNLGDRMDLAITYITLDTNIWLKHCGRIFKCVRNGVIKVLIPLIVFQELRALRKLAEATIADAATRLVIIIRELYLTREILPLRFDGTVALDINETTEFENNLNWRSLVDETILNSVNEHDEIGKKLMKGHNMALVARDGQPQVVLTAKTAKVFRYCILITDDRNMRLRAKTIGLTSFQLKWLFTQLETVFPNKCID